MQACLVLLAIIQLGHALSMEASCSIKDIQICNTCKNVQCEVDSNNLIGSFTDVSSSDECQDWCRRRNDYMGDCRYLTYFGNKGYPVENTCYIFPSCGQKAECENCVTETFDCFSVVFRESVRKNAWDCFEKKGFAENRHFQGTANFGYLEAIKCHFEARNRKFG